MSDLTLDDLRQFIRAGGVPSLSEWLSMAPPLRAAITEEAEVLRIERAVMIGTAAHGPAAAAEILSDIDGGEMSRRLALRASAERIIASEVAAQKGVKP